MVFVYFAFLIYNERTNEWLNALLAFLILITAVYFHPLTVFVFGFCILFFLISKGRLISTQKRIFSAVAWALIVVSKVYIAKVSSYDVGSMKRFTTNVVKPIAELK